MNKYLQLTLRIAVGLTIAYAGMTKLLEPIENFEAAIRDFQIFPLTFVRPIALVVPWAEWILGSLLIVGYAPRIGALGCGALALSFALITGYETLQGRGAEFCGCFGEDGLRLTTSQMFMLDVSLFVGSAILAMQKYFPWSLQHFFSKSKTPPTQ